MSQPQSAARAVSGEWPPGPRGWLPGGALLFLRRHPDVFLELARRFGDVVYFRVGPQRVFLLSRLEDIRHLLIHRQQDFAKGWGPQAGRSSLGEGLISAEGEIHRRERRRLQPLFSSERIGRHVAAMAAEAERVADRWRDGQRVDIWHEMQGLTLAVIGRTLLGCDTLGERIYRLAADVIARRFLPVMTPWPSALRRLSVVGQLRLWRVRARLDAAVSRVIESRREARSEDLVAWLSGPAAGGHGVTTRLLHDHFVTFLLAGHETTAAALSWSLHLLAQHPESQGRLQAEVDDLLPGSAAVEALPRLEYSRRVVSEALRLYPPLWMLGRRALREVEIGGYQIPAGSLVLASPYIAHRDPRFFPDPLRFNPDRWGGAQGSPELPYFPFGLGARSCIAADFAFTEAMVVLAILNRRWRLRPVSGAPVRIEPLLTLRPRGGVPLRVTSRPR